MKNSLCLVLLAVTAFWLAACGPAPKKPDARHEAAEFFLKIGEGRFQDAYESATFAFQAQTTFKNFQATAKDLGLSVGTVSCNWTKEERLDRDIKLTGEVMSNKGTAIPVFVTLIQERGAWRVFSLRVPGEDGNKEEDRFSLVGKGSSFTHDVNMEVPAPRVLEGLVLESLLLFNDAIQKCSFRDFYAKVSLTWQNQLTEGQLKRAFQPFIDTKVNLDGIRKLTPNFSTPPAINSDGMLVLVGYYDTKPSHTYFTLRFSYELPRWKLSGLEIQLRD